MSLLNAPHVAVSAFNHFFYHLSHSRQLKVSIEIQDWKKFPLLFEGGVAGTSYSLIFLQFHFPDGVVDFELDGAPHGEFHKIQEDENRDKFLESFGFTVLRFENRFVFQEPEYLISEINIVINKEENRSDKPINHPGRN